MSSEKDIYSTVLKIISLSLWNSYILEITIHNFIEILTRAVASVKGEGSAPKLLIASVGELFSGYPFRIFWICIETLIQHWAIIVIFFTTLIH